jgi:hypothetical protein
MSEATEEPTDDAGVITSSKFRMWLRPDDIVQLVWAPGSVIEVEDAVAAIAAVARLSGGRHHPMIVDVHRAGQVDRAARVELSRGGDQVSAVAAIVGTPLSRMMGNLIMNVSRPPMPMRLFDDEASAVAWLHTFLG